MDLFETVESAERRTKEKMDKIKSGTIKKKDHVGNFDNYNWDKELLETEVKYLL